MSDPVVKRFEFAVPPNQVDFPLLITLVNQFGVGFNILRAEIKEDGGFIMLDISADDVATITKATDYIVKQGISIKGVGDRVIWDEKKCTQCGYCPTYCPTNALVQDRKTLEVSFDKSKCVICGVCLKICPVRALSLVPVTE